MAQAILHKLLDHARALGCAEAWVLTDRTNQGAMHLYESIGGVEAVTDDVMFAFPLNGNDAERR